MKTIQTTCNYCALSCGLSLTVDDSGQIVNVLPKQNYPVNDGLFCIKGMNIDKQRTVYKPSPLPKIRQADGSMKEVSWQEAFDYIAQRLLDIKEKHGSQAIAGISTGQLLLEDYAIAGHVIRNGLQAHLDGNTRLCMATAVVAHKQSFGFDAPGYTLQDAELSDTLIFIGNNPAVAHPVLWSRVRASRKDSDRIIVIDPRVSQTAKEADYHYPIKHAGDLPLLYTVANLLIQRDKAIDYEFIKNSTNGYDEFKDFVKDYTLDKVYESTGLTAEQVLELVGLIETGERVSFWWCMGVNQHIEGVRVAQAIINLALMTGNIGKPGTGANSLTGQTNAMSSRLYSNTTGMYAGRDFSNPEDRQLIADVLGVEPDYLAKGPTIPYHKIIEQANEGKIKAIWSMCTNGRHSFSNNETFRSAAEKVDLFIVQDIYDDTESAEYADVFLPVVPGLKKTGTITNTERRLSPVRPVLALEENEKTDFQIFLGVGQALGMDMSKWQTPRQTFEMMKEISRGMPCDITGVDWDELSNSNGVQWPLPEGDELKEDQRRLYEDGKFFTPNQKANFVFEEPRQNPVPQTKEFPIVFNTGRSTPAAWHTRTRTREIEGSRQMTPDEAYVVIGVNLAQELNVGPSDKVLIHSSNGQSAVFNVQISKYQRDDEVFSPLHYIECNRLTQIVYDPYSFEPDFKITPVRVEKAKS